MEAILDRGLPYASGPEWLRDHVLPGRWTLAVAGTHGKTTTASMLAWVLEYAGLAPGFLIGGVPGNFGVSARLTDSAFFVIEGDEYDTAFFDKRSKFVHYRPRTAILNNLEYDHADIFPDLGAIETQFHHLVRTVRTSAASWSTARMLRWRVCWPAACGVKWKPSVPPRWHIPAPDGRSQSMAASSWAVQRKVPCVSSMTGRHNQLNALAAIAAARHAGVPPRLAIDALAAFKGIKRRMELRGVVRGVSVYDDFPITPRPSPRRSKACGARWARRGYSRSSSRGRTP